MKRLIKFCLVGMMVVSCGKGEPIYMVGKLVEGIGQAPRKIGRALLGIKETKERFSEENKAIDDELLRLYAEIDNLLITIETLKLHIGDMEVNQTNLYILLSNYEKELKELENAVKDCKKGKPCKCPDDKDDDKKDKKKDKCEKAREKGDEKKIKKYCKED